MFDFVKSVVEVIVDVVTGGGNSTGPPNPTDPCNAPACVAAKTQLAGERKTYERICLYLKILQSVLNVATAIIATPFWLIAVLIAIAVLVPVLAVFILVFLVAYAFAWYLVVFVLPGLIAKVGEALLTQQGVVAEAIRAVVENCPEACRGDISMPECELNQLNASGS